MTPQITKTFESTQAKTVLVTEPLLCAALVREPWVMPEDARAAKNLFDGFFIVGDEAVRLNVIESRLSQQTLSGLAQACRALNFSAIATAIENGLDERYESIQDLYSRYYMENDREYEWEGNE